MADQEELGNPAKASVDAGTSAPAVRKPLRFPWTFPEPTVPRDAVRLADPHWATLLATALTAFVVYLATLARHVGAFDVAEFQTIPHLFGIAHPTGYPLFTILGGIWSRIPFGGMATRMNVLSALLFSAAAGTIAALGMKLRVRPAVAALTALLFSFASGTWSNAVHIDVQSLHLVLLGLLLLAWIAARERPSPRTIAPMCLVTGLGLAHHGLMALTGLPLLAAYALSHPRVVVHWRTLAVALPALVLPLGFFLYLPLRARSAPIVNADPTSGWWNVARGEGFRGSLLQRASLTIWRSEIGTHLTMLRSWMGLLALLTAVAGVGVLARRDVGATVALVAVALVASYVTANAIGATERYLMGVVLVVAVFAGVAVDRVLGLVVENVQHDWRPAAGLAGTALVALMPISAFTSNFRSHDVSDDRADSDNGMRVLESLPQGCVLWVQWDLRTTFIYLHRIEHVRPDLTILDARSIASVGGDPQPADLFDGVQRDPFTAGRPVCYIPQVGLQIAADPGIRTSIITETERRWGLERIDPGPVYLVERTP